ncbi:unnamed protein product, partial [Tilletia controversa]
MAAVDGLGARGWQGPSSPRRSGGHALKNSIGFPRTSSLHDSEFSPKDNKREGGGGSRSGGRASNAAQHWLSNFGRMLKPFLMGSKGKADQNRIEEGSALLESAPVHEAAEVDEAAASGKDKDKVKTKELPT